MTTPPTIFSYEFLFGTTDYPDDLDPNVPVNGADELRAWLRGEPGADDASARRTIAGEVADRLHPGTGDYFDAVSRTVAAVLTAVRDAFQNDRRDGDAADLAAWLAGTRRGGKRVTDRRAAAAAGRTAERAARRVLPGTAYPVAAVAAAVVGGVLHAVRVAFAVTDDSTVVVA